MKSLLSLFVNNRNIDWILFFSTLPIMVAGLFTMSSFIDEGSFAQKQLIWIVISLVVFFVFSLIDWRFMKRTEVLTVLFIFSCIVLALLFLGSQIRGIKGWISFGSVFFQPVEATKIILILILSKYFSRRHIEIANIKHILISGVYAFIPFVLVFFQPDFGSSVIIFSIWLGMIMVSGVSKKHLLAVFVLGVLAFLTLWFFVFLPYQKERILTFLNPLSDIQGSGYSSFQSQIAIGSGEIFGRGVGYGTQSRLRFLPEYQTDFIFAAFAEEWGFIGVVFLFLFFGIVIYRILANSLVAPSNFETLFGVGLAIFFMTQFAINVGMNIGLLPVTGITLPFMSYGGSHLLAEFSGLGILMGMRRHSRGANKGDIRNEFLGPI